MLRKLSRYYHTIKHLKLIQIRYQIYYRLRNKFFPVKYPFDVKTPKHQKLNFHSFPNQFIHYFDGNHFKFLNLEEKFKDDIDWNYLGYGKLWAYHLNYFDYLHQPDMDWEEGELLIDSFLDDISNRNEGMEAYPISLRLINWVKFLSINDKYPKKVLDSIFAQYSILEKKIEFHLLGNHLLENGFSFLFGAVFFSNPRLEKLARQIVIKELDEQILEDGAHFELSPMYHIILLQRALDGYNLLVNNAHNLQDVQDQLGIKIQKMLSWLKTITIGDSDIPMLNDSVSGQSLNANTILEYGKQLGFLCEEIELTDSGYRKLEWNEFQLICDIGDIGPTYQPAHAHSDTLTFILYHNDRPVIVDTGISTYEKNNRRKLERSTESHNTVVINGKDQTDIWGGFRVGKRAKTKVLRNEKDLIKVNQDGYKDIGCIHEREWKINDNGFRTIDKIIGNPKSAFAYFHFHPDLLIKRLENNKFKIDNLYILFENATSIKVEGYQFCMGFNYTINASRIKLEFNTLLKTTITK